MTENKLEKWKNWRQKAEEKINTVSNVNFFVGFHAGFKTSVFHKSDKGKVTTTIHSFKPVSFVMSSECPLAQIKKSSSQLGRAQVGATRKAQYTWSWSFWCFQNVLILPRFFWSKKYRLTRSKWILGRSLVVFQNVWWNKAASFTIFDGNFLPRNAEKVCRGPFGVLELC